MCTSYILISPITPNINKIPKMEKVKADNILTVSALKNRAIICDPIITSKKDVHIKAVIDPKATQKTYKGFDPAISIVLIWVLSPISDRNTTPNVDKNKRHSNLSAIRLNKLDCTPLSFN